MNSEVGQNNKVTRNDECIKAIFPDIKKDLMEENEQNIEIKTIKSPEISIKINQVPVNALIDTGSAVNALSENWYNNNKKLLGNHEILSVNNTTIVSAVGNKSKHIKRQVFCETILNDSISVDCVFLIVPGLVRDCILGMNFLQQSKSVINIPEKWIKIQPELGTTVEEGPCEVPLLVMEEDIYNMDEEIRKKLDELDGVDQARQCQLEQLLHKNKRVFNERPGLITGYQHYFPVSYTHLSL